MPIPTHPDPTLTPVEPRSPQPRLNADRVAALGFLAGGVAHQINNALTPVRLSLGRLTSFELSRRPLSPEHHHRVELLQDIREGFARIERVVRELRAFSHNSDGPSRPVDLGCSLEVAIGFAGHEIRHRARLVCEYGAVPLVRAKPAELRQVFLNLLVNAAQAITEGQAHLNEIRVVTRTDDRGRAVVEVHDSGAGITPELQHRIFEPFFTTKPTGSGLGLGLAVCRDIVSSLGGEITIASDLADGTTARVVLPSCEDSVVAVEPTQAIAECATARERRRVLIVDDDRPVAAAIALELSAHDVIVAESGREALEILRHDRDFDVVLCDLMMPEVTGMDVYEAVRRLDPRLAEHIVMMTGGAFTQRAGQFLAESRAPVIEKPFQPGQLDEVVIAVKRRCAEAERSDDHARPLDHERNRTFT